MYCTVEEKQTDVARGQAGSFAELTGSDVTLMVNQNIWGTAKNLY